jgi:transcriptional regulator with XRE-family HTH domain
LSTSFCGLHFKKYKKFMNDNKNKSNTNSYGRSVRPEDAYTSPYTSDALKCKLEKFGERLKQARKKLGLSQKELGKKIGASPNTIYNYETGHLPKSQHLASFSYLLNCSIDWLLTGEEENLQLKPDTENSSHESQLHPLSKPHKPPVSELITKTIEVLESDTVYSDALSANIQAFNDAVKTEQKLRELQEKMEYKFSKFEERLNSLEAENRELKDKLADQGREGGGKAANEG